MVCIFLVSFNFLSCYWPKDVIEMLLLWHDEFKRNDNLEKKCKNEVLYACNTWLFDNYECRDM